jgi:uncharacterized protein Yka (UPF0111/DUF47 family)
MNFEEDDIRFLLEAVKETVITYREQASDMSEDGDSPQDITNMHNYVSRLERLADNIEKELDKTYFE